MAGFCWLAAYGLGQQITNVVSPDMTSSTPGTDTGIEALLTEGCHCLSHEVQNGVRINIKQTAHDLGILHAYGTL